MRIRTPFYCLTVLLLAAMCLPAFAQPEKVQLQHDAKAKQVKVSIGGELFTVFHLGTDLPKPFASPVYGPGGTVMTREIAKPGVKVDHPHHKGIWVSVDEVNEVKFWAEEGKIENVKAEVDTESNPVRLTLVNHWLSKEGKPVLEETTIISFFRNRLMAYDITFKALEKPVTFDDTKEGLFGFRMVDSMRESETGTVVNSDGLNGTKEAWGKTADWVDYYGQIDGKTFGVALFDHPDNFRRSRYHVRNYGLFSISPFGEQSYAKQEAKPVTLEPGQALRLRYAIYIHAGDTKTAKVSEVFEKYTEFAKQ